MISGLFSLGNKIINSTYRVIIETSKTSETSVTYVKLSKLTIYLSTNAGLASPHNDAVPLSVLPTTDHNVHQPS